MRAGRRRATDLHIEKRDTSPRSRSKEAEARELEYAVADHDAPSPISIDSGGDLPCLSQTVEGASSILVDGGYAVDFATPIGGDRPRATGLARCSDAIRRNSDARPRGR
jgi:hypothetical protein